MDARSVIDKVIDGQTILSYYGFNSIDASHTTIRACCKLHDGDNTHGFIFDTERNMWTCCTGNCGSGDAYELVKRFEGCTYPEAIMKTAEIFNVDISNLELTTIKSANQKEKDEWLELVKKAKKKTELKPFTLPDLEIKAITHFRNFTKETIDHFEAFYTPSYVVDTEDKHYFLKDRICIPVTFHELLIGYALRRTNNEDMQKWSNQGFDSGTILYSYDSVRQFISDNNIDEIILVEGIFDVWQYWQQGIYNVVATFGAHITDEQVELLLGMTTTLVLSYDGDKTGRACTLKSIKELKYKFDLYVIPFDEGEDPGSCEELADRYKNKIFYTKYV
jgi:DNA primase